MKIKIDANGHPMTCYVLNKSIGAKDRPGILWIHGGGHIVGTALMAYLSDVRKIAKETGAIVLSPEYRLAGKAPYPADLEECYAALEYMYDNAEELGIDKNRISVGGESAGGGLTAAVCMYARDKGKVPVRNQFPFYPMLDCDDTDSSRDNHAYIWNTKLNHYAWKKYLRELDPAKPVPPYASPAKQTDYSNLPPCYTFIADGEAFYCETLQYVENLKKAGIDAKVDVFHSNAHAFDFFCKWTKASKMARRAMRENMKKMI